MALTEFLQKGPLSNPVKARSSITSKDCMDEENVVAHVLALLLLQNFHVPDVVLLNLPLAQAEKKILQPLFLYNSTMK